MGTYRQPKLGTTLLFLGLVSLPIGCKRSETQFTLVDVNRTVSGASKYPTAMDPSKVGTYPPNTKSGAGYFYDDVLEYRVWVHPERGGSRLNGDNDYYYAFAEYEKAESFSYATAGAEHPLVLIRQLEYINEPTPGRYEAVRSERVTEWRVEWLADDKRGPTSIEDFLKHPRPVKNTPDPNDDSDDDSN